MDSITRKVCVYCTTAEGTTRDHVVARGFFPLDRRKGIPLVPSCAACNNLKAQLERYATAVLPFGATHGAAGAILSTMVKPRLEGNLKLARTLARGSNYRFVSHDYGVTWDTEMTLPVDGDVVSRLFHMIVRGLAYAEYGLLLPDADCIVRADFLTAVGRGIFDQLHAKQGERTGVKDLGNGIFRYEGVQAKDSPQLTVWRMSLCGIVVGGDARARDERVSVVHAFTAPRRIAAASRLADFLRAQAA
jgi:hypothetical protein